MKIVFDTNVIVSGLVAEGLCREILEEHLPGHEPILSTRLWTELRSTLLEKFDLHPEELPTLRLYERLATWVEPPRLKPPVCRDPDDDWVLATALAGKADAIVTGDKDLLVLRRHQGVVILTPRNFLERPLHKR